MIYDQRRIKLKLLNIILNIRLNLVDNILALVKYSNGVLSIIKPAYGLHLGSIVKSINLPLHLYFQEINFLGIRIYLKFLKANTIFFDIGLFTKNPIYSKSAGTFSQILQINKELNLILIRLPSRKKKYVNFDYMCTLGRNNNIFKKFLIKGKAGIKRNLGFNKKVRGVAKNPVDHPHGGRTKTNQPEVSPWGWIAKRSH